MSIDQNKSLVRELFAAANAGLNQDFLSLLAPDFSLWIPGDENANAFAGTKTRDHLANTMNKIHETFPKGLIITITSMIGEGNYVSAEGFSHGRAANGRDYDQKYHWLFEIKDNLIVSMKEYMDTLHLKNVLIDK